MTNDPRSMQDSHRDTDSARRLAMTDGLGDLSTTASNVLVLAPTHGGYWQDACHSLSTHRGIPSTKRLVLTYVYGAAAYLSQIEDTMDDPPELAIIEATGDTNSPPGLPGDWPVEIRHEAPGDLTGIGIQSSEFLTRWHNADDVAVCVESITAMLQYVPIQTAYRFLHVLTHRVTHAGATAHYHMSPGAHSEQELGTLKQLFDAIAEYDTATDTWTVAER